MKISIYLSCLFSSLSLSLFSSFFSLLSLSLLYSLLSPYHYLLFLFIYLIIYLFYFIFLTTIYLFFNLLAQAHISKYFYLGACITHHTLHHPSSLINHFLLNILGQTFHPKPALHQLFRHATLSVVTYSQVPTYPLMVSVVR